MAPTANAQSCHDHQVQTQRLCSPRATASPSSASRQGLTEQLFHVGHACSRLAGLPLQVISISAGCAGQRAMCLASFAELGCIVVSCYQAAFESCSHMHTCPRDWDPWDPDRLPSPRSVS